MARFKVTLTRLVGTDAIGVRHLDYCSREVAGDAARAFAPDGVPGDVLTIVEIEILAKPKQDKSGAQVFDADGMPVMMREERKDLRARAVCGLKGWESTWGTIMDVTHFDAPKPELKAETAKAESAWTPPVSGDLVSALLQ